MSDAPDISREAVEHLASGLTAGCAALDEHGEQHLDPLTAPVAVDPMVLLHASAMIRALRAALDAALEELRETVDARQRTLTTLRLQEACWARTRAKRAAAEAERDKLRAELAEVLAENDAVRFQLNNVNAVDLAPEPSMTPTRVIFAFALFCLSIAWLAWR